MIISLIVAAAENNVIGKDNGMLWHLPSDLKYFKAVTMGHHVIMGRKTHQALGGNLPGRTNVIITRQPNYSEDGALIVHSLEEALNLAKQNGETEAMILGGGSIYEQALPDASRVYLTRVHNSFEGDTYFPKLSEAEWEETKKEFHAANEKNKIDFTFFEYERM